MTKTAVTKILKLSEEFYDLTNEELRVSLTVGKNYEPEYRVWVQEKDSFTVPTIDYLPYDEDGLLEHIQHKIENIEIENEDNYLE